MPTGLSHRPSTMAALGRCDRCPATARYQAVLSAGALLFCAHHAREHRARLLEIGVRLSPVPDTSGGPIREKGSPR